MLRSRGVTVELRLDVGEASIEALGLFTRTDEGYLASAVDELLLADDEYVRCENLNLQLGLLCGRPVPTYSSVTQDGVDHLALWRPLLDCS
jgi:hypothetical protein